jgi:hypothetical protein
MLVVPIAKDLVKTADEKVYRVISYTNYKDGGPAVYCRAKGSSDSVLVYFFDIVEINKTRVDYQRGSRVFRALGKISRDQHLPQPDDKVIVLKKSLEDSDSKDRVEVVGLKLKSKSLGVNKGLFVKGDDDNHYRLKEILDIDRAIGSDYFDREKFLAYYSDYTGL